MGLQKYDLEELGHRKRSKLNREPNLDSYRILCDCILQMANDNRLPPIQFREDLDTKDTSKYDHIKEAPSSAPVEDLLESSASGSWSGLDAANMGATFDSTLLASPNQTSRLRSPPLWDQLHDLTRAITPVHQPHDS